MSVARASVKRPVAVSMMMLAVVVVGVVCFLRLPVDLLPEITFPTLTVRTSWPNVSPEEMELMVTRPIEQAVSSANNLYRVSSTTSQGLSLVRVEFNYGTEMDGAAVDVLQLVERARPRLPDDPSLTPPVVTRFNPNDLPILRYAVSSPGSEVKLRSLVDDQIVPRLEAVNGVGAAEVVGGAVREIRVSVDGNKLRAHNLTIADVSRRLGQENSNVPGGIARDGRTELAVRALGLFESVEEMESVVLTSYQGQPVYLKDVADVLDGKEEQRIFTRLDGQPAVGIWVRKQSTANTVDTAHGVEREVERIKRDHPELAWGVTSDNARFIERAVHHTQQEALIGAVLAVLVILFFLRNLRSTLVISLSIPISLAATFALLYMYGFTLNVMSLSGIALAVGLIVDDAIVVLENIFRHHERDGAPPTEASILGANEVGMAVVASTVTVMVVFLPLLFVRGVAGQMYNQLALTIVFAIGMSLVMAMTLVPMMASRMLGAHATRPGGWLGRLDAWAEARFHALDEGYRRVLMWALEHRLRTLLGAGVLLGASLLLVPVVGVELMPATDNGDFEVSMRLPVGTALDITDQTFRRVEERLRDVKGVETVFSTVGGGGGGGGGRPIPNVAQATVRLARNAGPTARAMREARRTVGGVPGGTLQIRQNDLVARLVSGGDRLELRIFGSDPAELVRLARDVQARIEDVPGLANVDLSWEPGNPELRVVLNREKAATLGLSFADVASTVSAATSGSVPTFYEEGGFSYPIRVQLREDQRRTVEALSRITLRAGATQLTSQIALPRGQWVRLDQVARIEVAQGPSEITRMDRARYIAVTGNPAGRAMGEVVADVDGALRAFHLPEGYRFQWGGAQEQVERNFADLWLAVALAIALIYMVLASQFESYVHPLTIMLSVPLSIVGVVLALFLTGRSFGMTAFIGLLMLVGIVVKNAILLVDYTNVLRGEGMDRDAALLRAGPTRLRPILMTTGATVLGMLPLALGLGAGTETQAPMATAVIGGLLTSTLLTLVVIPVVYALLDERFEKALKRDA